MNSKNIWKKILSISIIIFALYLITIVLVTGLYEGNKYTRVYKEDFHLNYEDKRMQVISLALLAPSSHNIQPWNIELDETDDSKMMLYIDSDRILPSVDQYYSQMIISCGIFLTYVKEAGKTIGYEVSYDVFPNGEMPYSIAQEELQDWPIATIYVTETDDDTAFTFDAFASPTSKQVYNLQVISKDVINDLYRYESLNIELDFLRENLDSLKDLLIQGVQIESTNQAAMEETSSIFRYNNYQKNDFGYGLTMNTSFSNRFMLANIEMFTILFPMSWEQEGEYWLKNETANIQSCNTFGIIYGDHSRISELEAGIAFGHIYLLLRDFGLSVQPIVQLTETYPEMMDLNETFSETYANGKTVHMIYRLGYVDGRSLQTIRLNPEDIIV